MIFITRPSGLFGRPSGMIHTLRPLRLAGSDLIPENSSTHNLESSEMRKELSRMKKTKYTEEQIIGAVKQLEAGRAAKDLARELGVTDQTLYNWKAKYSGMDVPEAKRLRALE